MFSIDTAIFNWLFLFGHKINADWLFIFLGKYLPYLMVVVFIWFLYKEVNLKNKIFIAGFLVLIELLSRGIITQVIRFIYHRDRPFIALGVNPMFGGMTTGSFPSGHAVFFFSLALVSFLINRKWGWIMTTMAFLVSISRVIAGVHWPSDIIAGAVIALLIFWGVYLMFPKDKFFSKGETEENKNSQ